MASGRKYHGVPETVDLVEAVAHVSKEAHARVCVNLWQSAVNPACLILRVEFRDQLAPYEDPPTFVYQTTLGTQRKVDLVSVMHRIVYEAWAAYHREPWQWTTGMRASARSEQP